MDDFTDETLKFRSQRTVSTGDTSLSGVSSGNTVVGSGTTRSRILRSTLFWVSLGMWGWWFPKYLVPIFDKSILFKTPPFQVTAAGDVILDFTLNEKVADPPIISCTCRAIWERTRETISLRDLTLIFFLSNSCPAELLKLTGLYLPFVVTVLHAYVSSRRAQKTMCLLEICTVIACFSMAIGLSEGTTQMLKLWVQRRRPSFYDLCGFDIKTLKCQATADYVREASLSFPSGHSSLSCCGMTFSVWYFLGKIKNRERWMTFLIAVIPWGWSIFVAGSRLVDKWHHPSDVVAGLGLGFATCTIAYHVWYPPVWSSTAGIPRPMLDDLDSSGNSKLPSFNE